MSGAPTADAHTPGPWHFDGVCQIVEAERPHMRVAFLPSDHAEYASSLSNGRLIAAAPDLVKALEPFAKACEAAAWPTFEHDSTLIDASFGLTVGDLRAARAALTAAKTGGAV